MEEESLKDDIFIPSFPDKQNPVKPMLINTCDTFNVPIMAHGVEYEAHIRDKTEGVPLASPVSTPEKEESRKRPNSGIDLNKKPRQKPKKHRPKILDDSQVKRKPKAKVSVNFQPKTPEKKATSKPRAEKRTNMKKTSSNVVFSEDMDIANKACRRSLNLDVEVEEAKVEDVCINFDKDGDSDIQKYDLIEKVEKNRFAKQYQRRKKRMDSALNLGSSSEPVMSTIANRCSYIPSSLEHLAAETAQATPMISKKRRLMVRRQRVNRTWGTSKQSSGSMDLFVCMVGLRSRSLNWRRKRSEGCTQRRSYAFGNIKFMCSKSPSLNLLQHLPKARRENRMKYMQQRRQNNLKSVSQNEIVKLIKECFPQQHMDSIDCDINYLCGRIEFLCVNERYVQQQQQQLVSRVPKENCKHLIVRKRNQDQNVQLRNRGQLVVPKCSMILAHKDSKKKKKKKKPQVKVDLDEESERVWTMLMDSGGNTYDKQAEEDPERREYWNRERETTRSRVDSFVSILRGFQGNRCFTRWKGSVVDSVVGAFLTQNVTDYLSSTSFMNLAAIFSSRRNSSAKAKVSGPPCVSEAAVTIDHVHEKKTSEEITSVGGNQACEDEVIIQPQPCVFTTNIQVNGAGGSRTEGVTSNKKTPKGENDEKVKTDWDNLRKIYNTKRVRNDENQDAVDWEAVRKATVGEFSYAIKERGMNNVLAKKIKDFLDRMVQDHGSMDLEWIRDLPPQDAKDFLLSIFGMGLKSVECVRLLSLHHVAFPADVNVGRIAVRLGWVPLQPLPGGLEMHLLNNYPVIDTIQKYLYPRLCSLDHNTLYELHYHMITFGKVFCTKIKPSCHSCPLQSQCKHYASLSASKRLALPAPPTKNRATDLARVRKLDHKSMEPIVEEPPSPKHENEMLDIEDYYIRGPKDATYESNDDPNGSNERNEYNTEAPIVMVHSNTYGEDMSKSLVVADNRNLVRNDMSLRSKPIKDRLRTIHLVFELPDDHPILRAIEADARDPDDRSPYLFTVWQEDLVVDGMPNGKLRSYFSEDSTSVPPEVCLEIVQRSTFYRVEEDRIAGTLMIPVRSANYGNFPLNGTYFQINEVFADHETSQKPIVVSKSLLYGLPRRLLFCGAHITPTMKGLPIELIHHAFSQGYFCNRAFDRRTRFIAKLSESFHVKTNKQSKNKRANAKVTKRPSKQRPSKQHEGIV